MYQVLDRRLLVPDIDVLSALATHASNYTASEQIPFNLFQTGSLEGQHFRKTGKLVSLSEQNLVDCSAQNHGCEGGLMDRAFDYIHVNGGLDTEKSYSYHADEENCHFKPTSVGASDNGFMDIKTGSEADLMKAIASVGPISIAIDASQKSFMFYSNGNYNLLQNSARVLPVFIRHVSD
jgi:hypothetical protein